MKRKNILSLLLALCLVFGALAMPAAAADARTFVLEESLADSLKALGLFKGVSDTNYALDRWPNRAQTLVMLLRLMGLEQAALSENCAHPFEDTADCHWADPYIGYAYQHGLTKGTNEEGTQFSGTSTADSRTYLTFALRALGYVEGKGGDFLWESPIWLAQTVGIAPYQVHFSDFRRADMVTISYAALSAKLKNSEQTLAEALIERGAISADTFARCYDPDALANGIIRPSVTKEIRLTLDPDRLSKGIDISGQSIRYHGSVALIGDAGYELYGFYQAGARRVAQQIANAAAAVEGSARVFSIIVPNRMGALLSYADAAGLCRTQKTETEGIAYAYEQMGDKVVTVDAMTNLRLHNDEYIFFRTDHHWTALGSYYAYQAWAEAAGFVPVSLDQFEQRTAEGHLGYFYSVCGKPAEMRQNADTIVAYAPRSSFTCTPSNAMDYNTSIGYNIFLGGDRGITTIVNNDISDDSACVLVKDSYGNPFATWLTQHYHTVYVIDYRHYRNLSGYLSFSQFVAQKGVQDFIILLPMTLSQSDDTASYLAKYCW